jgi:hypothetical protein
MERTGAAVDVPYLVQLGLKTGPLHRLLTEAIAQFHSLKSVIKTNAALLKDSALPSQGLFGKTTRWVFGHTKPAHKRKLFIDVLGLEPVNEGKQGDPSIDKAFQREHSKVPEVAAFTKITKIEKLISTYSRKFLRILSDHNKPEWTTKAIRAAYSFVDVLTGRAASHDPSLHQIPTRSAEAKHIKRAFVAPPGYLIVKCDFSAHEFGVWAYVSRDEVLMNLFRRGREMRRKLYTKGRAMAADAKAELIKMIKLFGDPHIINASEFFSTKIEKVTPEQRGDVKSLGFGSIYGKSPRTVAEELGKTLEWAEGVLAKLFGKYKKAGAWLENIEKFFQQHCYAAAPTGRRRNLFAHLTGQQGIIRATARKARNSPIQGMASDIAFVAARLFQLALYRLLRQLKRISAKDAKLPVEVRVMVHDSIFTHATYQNVILAMHLLHHCCTTGTKAYYGKHFDVDFVVPPQIEIEIGYSEDKLYKWNWDPAELPELIQKAVNDIPQPVSHKAVYETIMADWKSKSMQTLLHEKYPVFQD